MKAERSLATAGVDSAEVRKPDNDEKKEDGEEKEIEDKEGVV